MTTKEHLSPTDIICIVAMCLLSGLYAYTREADLKTTLLGVILFFMGRVSKANGLIK